MCFSAMVNQSNKKLGLAVKVRTDNALIEETYRRTLEEMREILIDPEQFHTSTNLRRRTQSL